MGNFEIQDPPVFQVEITKWSRETNADGDEMGRDMEKVFNNTIYNKAMIERERNVTEVLLTAVLTGRRKTVCIYRQYLYQELRKARSRYCTVRCLTMQMRKPERHIRKRLALSQEAAEALGLEQLHLRWTRNRRQTVQ